jgi:hypothetical protein
MGKQKKAAGKPHKTDTTVPHANGFDLLAAYEAKLAESGIPKKEGATLQLQPVKQPPAWVAIDQPGIVIPYFSITGNLTKFQRYRYLRQPPRTGFSALIDKKPVKYSQPPNSLNELYLPPVIDWEQVAEEQLLPILITEGEFKAASACLNTEYACVGLGGVWSWRAGKRKMDMLPAFDDFKWEQRPVFIVYDSDAVTNPMVMQAENALAKALTERGAEPHIVRLPMDEDEKMGLDDYIVKKGVPSLERLLEEAEIWANAKELHRLNEDVVYVRDPGLIFRMDNMQRMSPRAFTDHAFSTRTFVEETQSKKGTVKTRKSAPKEWIQWPSRAEVPRITYAPGEPKVTEKRELNIWPGWGCEPVPGDITPWNMLLDMIFHKEPDSRLWFERWCAYPLQHPGVKLYSSAVIWGLAQGTGKSLIGYTLMKIYGRNATEIGDEELKQVHNEWAENKQFIMGDEITTGDKRGMSDKMKSMITRQLLRLNPKFIPAYTVPDVINYYFTSNHPDSFFLEDNDRRYFIHEVRAPALPEPWYSGVYEPWMGPKLTVGPGIPALFHHLLTLDLGDFNPSGRAMMTKSKRDMMDAGRSDLAYWVSQLKENPDGALSVDGHVAPFALWRSEDLLVLYENGKSTKVTVNGLSRELTRQGFAKVGDGMPIRTADGQHRLWSIRPIKGLENMSLRELAAHYDNERARNMRRMGVKQR